MPENKTQVIVAWLLQNDIALVNYYLNMYVHVCQ